MGSGKYVSGKCAEYGALRRWTRGKIDDKMTRAGRTREERQLTALACNKFSIRLNTQPLSSAAESPMSMGWAALLSLRRFNGCCFAG